MACTRANRFFVERDALPSGLVTELRRTASFQNPEFYKKQAMRFSTADLASPRTRCRCSW